MKKSPTSDGAPASIEPELPAADWDDWGYKTTCKLWEAVALSFGVSPASLDTFPGFDLVRPIPVPGRFKVRLSIAMNRVEEFRRSQGMDDRFTPPYQFIVSLPRFAEWARDTLTRDTLPDEFLSMIPTSDDQKPNVTMNVVGEKKWTTEFIDEVRAYRANHTEKETAENYGVSGTLIRRKLAPPKKTTAKPFDGLGSRAK